MVWGLGLVGGMEGKGDGHPTKDTSSQKPNFASNLFPLWFAYSPPLLGKSPKPREGGREEPKREERK